MIIYIYMDICIYMDIYIYMDMGMYIYTSSLRPHTLVA